MIESKEIFIIKENFKDLLDKEIYEPLLCIIMNKSKIVFPDKYERILEQSNNESDFISNKKEFLDAKILFYSQQAKDIKFKRLADFLNSIQEEQTQIYDTIMEETNNVDDSRLYKEILERLKRMKENENLILFMPFDITGEIGSSLTSRFFSDSFSFLINSMRRLNKELVSEHIIYMIYPNVENKIVLKSYSNDENKIEFVHSNLLKKYIEVIDCDLVNN